MNLSILIDPIGSWITTKGFLRRYSLKKGDVVIDAGSFIGYFTIAAAKQVGPRGKVIAYEPSRSAFEVLARRLRRQRIKNVVAVNKALYKDKRSVYFPSTTASNSKLSVSPREGLERVETTTLEKELKKHKIKKVDFLKMDIEGAEVEALAVSKKVLKSIKNMAVACYHKRGGETTDKLLVPFLKRGGLNTKVGFPLHRTLYAKWGKF